MTRRIAILLLAMAAFGALAGAARPLKAAELILFERKYCPWCIRWNREIGIIYAKTEEGRAAPLRRVDMDAPRPADLKAIRGLVYSPTFVLLDDAGREVGRIEGYQYEGAFWAALDALLEKMKRGQKP